MLEESGFIDAAGQAIPELRKVLKWVAQAGIIFATGHVSSQEALTPVKAAEEEGSERS